MKNVIVVLLALLPVASFGSGGLYHDTFFERDVTYEGFTRITTIHKRVQYYKPPRRGYHGVYIRELEKVSVARTAHNFAWELIFFGATLFVVLSIAQLIVTSKKHSNEDDLFGFLMCSFFGFYFYWLGHSLNSAAKEHLHGDSYFTTAIGISMTVLALSSFFVIGSMARSGLTSKKIIFWLFLILSGILQVIVSFWFFPGSEELFYIWVASVVLWLFMYFLWKKLTEKIFKPTKLDPSEKAGIANA
jgi:uncharacterized membrane protein